MISNDIQELLKNITKSLIKIETKELDALISRQLTHIDNMTMLNKVFGPPFRWKNSHALLNYRKEL